MKLNFYGFKIQIQTKLKVIEQKLRVDFNYFVQEFNEKPNLNIIIELKENITSCLPENLVATKQSFNSITYDVGSIRYNDYYGEVVTKFDYQNESCFVYGLDEGRIHEVVYLVILSRQGKWFDRNGMHKIHAMGVSKNNKNMLLMLPMRGGKTTTFTKFLEDDTYNIISDDSPVIKLNGDVKLFPIRLGVEQVNRYEKLLQSIPAEFKSELSRKQFGTKSLIDLLYFKDRLQKVGVHNILVQGIRSNSNKFEVKKINKFQMFNHLVTNMIVGIGLPMIIEYFLESSIKDKVVNFRILVSRTIAAINLLLNSDCYLVHLGTNVDANVSGLKKLFSN